MNEQIKQQWIIDLLDNPNKQGKGSLRDSNDFYCCWGRLCNLHPEPQWRFSLIKNKYGCEDGDNVYYPPIRIQEWAGLTAANPTITIQPDDPLYDKIFNSKSLILNSYGAFKGHPIKTSLAALNDNGFTFEQIAQIIERYL